VSAAQQIGKARKDLGLDQWGALFETTQQRIAQLPNARDE
jgi:hypothetical protein